MPIWRAVVVIQSGGMPGPGTNTWHVQADPPVSDSSNTNGALLDMDTALTDFYTAFDHWVPGGWNASFDGEWHAVGGDDVHVTAAWGVGAFFGALATLPPADSLAVGWKASSGGRSGRGRTFMGPLATSTLEANGTPTETFRAAVQTAGNALVAAGQDQGPSRLVVYSPTDQIGRVVTSCTVPNKFASLRSRRD